MGLRRENVLKMMGASGDVDHGCLCFTALEASTVRLNSVGLPYLVSLEYAKNNGIWRAYEMIEEDGHYTGQLITLWKGDRLWLRSTWEKLPTMYTGTGLNTWCKFAEDSSAYQNATDYYNFAMTGRIRCSGSVSYLALKNGNYLAAFEGMYYSMFKNCTALVNTPYIPCTDNTSYQLRSQCFAYMFSGCTNLKEVNWSGNFYTGTGRRQFDYMFNNCTSLERCPDMTFHSDNYQSNVSFKGMFRNCTSLREAPVIGLSSAGMQSVGNEAFKETFYGCTSLSDASRLTIHTNTTSAYTDYSMCFYGCTALTKAPEFCTDWYMMRGAMKQFFQGCASLKSVTVRGIFDGGWINVTRPFIQTFTGCSSLNYINFLVVNKRGDTFWDSCFENWVNGVAADGIFRMYANVPVRWATSGNTYEGIPSGWTVEALGYYQNGNIYADSTYTTVVTLSTYSESNKVYYIDIPTNDRYYYDGTELIKVVEQATEDND